MNLRSFPFSSQSLSLIPGNFFSRSSIRPFTLFALFMREEVPGRWDLVVSAPWVSDQGDALNYLVDRIKTDLGPGALINLSRIVFVDPNEQAVQDLNRDISIEHGMVEVKDSNFLGLPIKQACFITSKRPEAHVGA